MKQRSHVIQLKPNNKQATYFEKACGCQRYYEPLWRVLAHKIKTLPESVRTALGFE